MISLSGTTRIFIYTGSTDMRKSFNRLSGLVAEHFDVQLLSGHLFLFFNRKRDCVKILTWDNDGLALWYKRLEAGTYQLSSLDLTQSSLEIDRATLSMLLSGIDLNSAKRRKRFKVA